MAKLVPYPHQLEGVDYSRGRNAVYYFIAPRGGKTLTTLLSIEETVTEPGPILIVSPATVLATWYGALVQQEYSREEIEVLDDRYKNKKMYELKKHLQQFSKKFCLVNFEKVFPLDAIHAREGLEMAIGLDNWATIVIDESIRISGTESTIGRYCSGVMPNYPDEPLPFPTNQKRYLLSGLPISESPLQLATQVLFAEGVYFGCHTIDEYILKFWRVDKFGRYEIRGKLHGIQIQNFINTNCYQLSLEELGLGGKIVRETALIPASEKTKEIVEYLENTTLYRMEGDDPDSPMKAMNPALKELFIQKIANGIHPFGKRIVDETKYYWFRDWWLEQGKPSTLIVSVFRSSIDHLRDIMVEAGARVGAIYAGVSYAEREQIRLDQEAGDIDITIAQSIPVKMGLDFSFCEQLVYFSNSWSLDTRIQSSLRLQNLKRTEPYPVLDMCMEGTNEEKIVNILDNKGIDVSQYLRLYTNL